MLLDRVAEFCRAIAYPPAWFMFGVWINGLLLLGAAQLFRSPVEQTLGVGFIIAAAFLSVAFHMDRALMSFIGFGMAASITGARSLAGFFIGDAWHGSIIIVVAWFIISYTSLRRAAFSFLAVYDANQ